MRTGTAAGGVGPGTTVQMLGSAIGQVTSAHLQYDDTAQRMLTSVTLQIDPSRIEIVAKLPKTRSGKIMRRLLRAQATGADIGDTSTLDE